MRISTNQIFTGNVNNLSKANADLFKTQQQISTGKKILQPSDDPLASAQIIKLKQEIAQNEQYQSNIEFSKRRLSLSEITLNQLFTDSTRLKELTIAAGNPGAGNEERAAIAAEVDEIISQMQGLMNTKDAQGEYLYSGFMGNTQAYVFDQATERYVFQGDSGRRSIQIGTDNQVVQTDSGTELFERVRGVGVPVLQGSASTNQGNQNFSSIQAETSGPVNFVIEVNGTSIPIELTSDDSDENLQIINDQLREELGNANLPLVTASLSDPDNFLILTEVPDADGVFQGLDIQLSVDPANPADLDLINNDLTTGFIQGTAGSTFPTDIDPERFIASVFVTDFADFNRASPMTFSVDDEGLFRVTNEDGSDVFTDTEPRVNLTQEGLTVETGDRIRFKGIEITIGALPEEESGVTFESSLGATQQRDNVLNVALDLSNGLKNIDGKTEDGKRQIDQLLAKVLTALEGIQDTNMRARGSIGARINALESQEAVNEDFNLFTRTALSSFEDLDYNEAISRFALQQTVLEAAYSSFNQIRNLSLFNYIS